MPHDVLAPLLHAAAMMSFPVIMGLSTSLCLRSAPSPFTTVAVHEYVSLTVWLDRVWLAAAAGWTLLAVVRVSEAGESSAALLVPTGAAAVVMAGLIAAHLWFQSVLTAELSSAAERVAAGGDVTRVADDGVLVAQRREHDGTLAFAAAGRGVGIYVVAGIAVFAVFVTTTSSAVASAAGPSLAQCIVMAGLYASLGVILVDLCVDVWPGFTTAERVKRASRYYVQVFEQWKNQGVLVGFLTVLIGAPYVYARGEAPAAVMSFPIWIATCLTFATFFNQVLNRKGIVNSRLPLPVWVNEYSVRYPLWAQFFAVIHLVMVAALVVGIAVIGI
jgi:hypothetical protein